jgi:hypothetical protein
MVSTYQNKSFKIGYLSVVAVWKHLLDWFYRIIRKIIIMEKNPQETFPELFFKV